MSWQALAAKIGGAVGPLWSSQRVALASIAGAWGLYLAFVTVHLTVTRFPHVLLLMPWECLSASAGAVITWIFYLIVRRLDRAAVALRITAALILAVPAAVLLAVINYNVLFVFAPSWIWSASFLRAITLRGVFGSTITELYFIFIAWATLYISVSSALESQEAHRRAAVLQAENRDAHLRALRYQLNPHFLFNALNTVSALVMRGDAEGAESTIQALSLFLRSALVTEALEDTTIAEELELQRLYLEIEQVRYRDRLRVQLSVPDALLSALLPPLLLQPLVENVIRHAVASSREPVTMTIGAFADAHGLHLLVEDDGRGGSAASGTGIGLRNAASRLKARFGAAARCINGPRPGGGYRVELVLPLVMQAGHT